MVYRASDPTSLGRKCLAKVIRVSGFFVCPKCSKKSCGLYAKTKLFKSKRYIVERWAWCNQCGYHGETKIWTRGVMR